MDSCVRNSGDFFNIIHNNGAPIMSCRRKLKWTELLKYCVMTESEWSASEDEDLIDSNDSMWNEELKEWNELLVYDIQLREQVNVESVPAFLRTQHVRGLTRLTPHEHFSFHA